MPSTLSRLILDVQDLKRSLAFYRDLLRLPMRQEHAWQGTRVAYLDSGATEILLLEQPKSEQYPYADRSGGIVICIGVRDLRSVAKALASRHVPVLQGLDTPLYGNSTLLVSDPDGYAVLLSGPAESMS